MRSCYAYHPSQFGIFSLYQVTGSPPRPRRRSWSATPACCREGVGRRVCAPSMISSQSAWDSGLTQVQCILFLYPRTITENTKPLDYSWIKQQFSISKVILQYSQKTRIVFKMPFFLPDAFRKRDAMLHGQETGNCTFQYDDVSIVMN